MSFQTSALLLSWVAILLLAFVVSGLVRQVHALTAGAASVARRVGPAVGAPAPRFEPLAPAVPGPLVLVFAGEGCRTCGSLLPRAAQHAGPGVTIRVCYPGAVPADAPEPRGALAEVHGGEAELFQLYQIVATPYGVLVDAAGRVVEALPIGSADALHGLLDRADALAGRAGPTAAPNAGSTTKAVTEGAR